MRFRSKGKDRTVFQGVTFWSFSGFELERWKVENPISFHFCNLYWFVSFDPFLFSILLGALDMSFSKVIFQSHFLFFFRDCNGGSSAIVPCLGRPTGQDRQDRNSLIYICSWNALDYRSGN